MLKNNIITVITRAITTVVKITQRRTIVVALQLQRQQHGGPNGCSYHLRVFDVRLPCFKGIEEEAKTRQLWDNYNQVGVCKRTGALNLPTNDAETSQAGQLVGTTERKEGY
jgi:hypothetical protein